MSPEEIARVAHAANRALQQVHADPTIPVSPEWDDEADEIRDGIVAGVRGVLAGLTPEQSHEGWMRARRDAGWVWGEVKDAERRTHPLLVPFAELPAAQQAKDLLFAAVARTLAAAPSSSAGDVPPPAADDGDHPTVLPATIPPSAGQPASVDPAVGRPASIPAGTPVE